MIEIIDQHTTVGETFMAGSDELTSEVLAGILSGCRHTARFISTDARVEAGEIPVQSVKRLQEVIQPLDGAVEGWIAVNPYFLGAGLEAIELGVRRFGMKSVGEMIQYMEDWVTDEYMVLPIVQLAGDLDVPINFHAGGAAHVEGVIHLAESYPRTRFIMAHFGGRAWRMARRLVKDAKLSNLYVEINGSPTPGQAAERIAAAIDAAGVHRLVLGTDFRLKPGARYEAGNQLLDALETMKLRDTDVERICSLNARELFELP
ncbi:MAG TPA: amidohydrolase family protein [Planctomycetota bacterium]|nr:amidohydrolase family protein [Planctomycetota bacterium]